MQHNIFSPKLRNVDFDSLSLFFRQAAQLIFVGSLIVLPILFIPNLATSLGYVKIMFIIVTTYATLIMISLSTLRSGQLSIYLPLPLILYWLFVAIAAASAILTNDTVDAVWGINLEVQTVGFMVILGLVITLGQVCIGARTLLLRALLIFCLVAGLVQFVYLLRLLWGAPWLSLGVLSNNTTSLMGSLNDLALFSGLTLLMILAMVQTLVRTFSGKIITGVLTTLALLIGVIVNFYAVWLIVGFVSLLTFLYLLSKDTWLKSTDQDIVEPPVSRFAMGLVAVVCLVAGSFIVSGGYLSAKVNSLTGVNYIEVRPSAVATLEILRSVYETNVFLGVGPNRFEDAWREYKDPTISETIFWNTNFTSGSGFIPTLFITVGLFGGLVFLAFMLSLIYFGYKTLVYTRENDPTWYKVTLVSIVAASYLWLVLFIYTPGPVILILTAGLTGILLAVYSTIKAKTLYTLDVTHHRQHGPLLIAGVLLVIITATSGLLTAGKQFAAEIAFNQALTALATDNDLTAYDLALDKATGYFEQDIYVAERARLRLAELNRLLQTEESNAGAEQLFQQLFIEGTQLASRAVALDISNPYNQALLGSFYGLLNPADYEGVGNQRDTAFNEAMRLDPLNPEYHTIKAGLVVRYGDLDQAREYLLRAISIKPNYTEAMLALSQLEIQAGNTLAAIETTRAIIRFEPQNPARYFQLGLLENANGNSAVAAEAYRVAIALDPNYANARYLLALILAESGEIAEALEQLKTVAISNPDNAELLAIINALESGDYQGTSTLLNVPVREGGGVSQQDDNVIVEEVPATDIVAPLNRPQNQATTETEVSEAVTVEVDNNSVQSEMVE